MIGHQRDGRPVDEHPLRERPRRAHAPDVVECLVDREDQRDGGDQQHDQARDAQAAGLARELVQVAQHLPRDVVGNQALDEPALQPALHLREHREDGEQRQRHREERHHRDGGREGQAAGREAEPVFAKTLAQHRCGVAPRKARKIPPELPAIHGGYHRS